MPIPGAYLQLCEVPPPPATNAELSDAYAQLFLCVKGSNRDKQKIIELQTPE